MAEARFFGAYCGFGVKCGKAWAFALPRLRGELVGGDGAVNVSVSACYLSATEPYASLGILFHNHLGFGLPPPQLSPASGGGGELARRYAQRHISSSAYAGKWKHHVGYNA